MKSKLLLIAAVCGTLFSCSSDDDNNNGGGGVTDTKYFPTTNNNFWKYDVVGDQISGIDSLFISGDTIINSVTHKKIKNRNQSTGIFANMLTNNGVKKSGDQAIASGKFSVNFNGFAFEIPFNDFTIFDQDAAQNAVLSTVSGTQTIDLQGTPATMDYVLTTKAAESIDSFDSNGENYKKVKAIYTIVNVKMTAAIQGFNVTILNNQDLVISKHYYAENIGVVYTDTDMQYQIDPSTIALAEQFGIALPIPETGAFMQEEFLIDYLINP